jgi:hypothetical protein
MDPNAASSVTGTVEELRQLILAAFEQAQASGKPDWRVMTLPVLKNRLLQMTDRQFSLQRYNCKSMPQLISLLPNVVQPVPGTNVVPAVQLIDETLLTKVMMNTMADKSRSDSHPTDSTTIDWRRTRIRDDLWNAMLDYESNSIYVLDRRSDLARKKELTDDDSLVLPTATRVKVKTWRLDFAKQSSAGATLEQASELLAWTNGPGRTAELPRALRGRWAEYLKRTISREIHEWFRSKGLTIPADVHVSADSRGDLDTDSTSIDEVVAVRRLRNTLIRALSLMTPDEMSALLIPASVVARMNDQQSKRS